MIHKGPTEAHNEGENGTQLQQHSLETGRGNVQPWYWCLEITEVCWPASFYIHRSTRNNKGWIKLNKEECLFPGEFFHGTGNNCLFVSECNCVFLSWRSLASCWSTLCWSKISLTLIGKILFLKSQVTTAAC